MKDNTSLPSIPNYHERYIITISTPSNFHIQSKISRFHVLFETHKNEKWFFLPLQPLKIQHNIIEIFEVSPQKANEPLNVQNHINIILLRFLNKNKQQYGEWMIGTLIRDIEKEGEIPFWPPWEGISLI